jgi:hypothetical protein
MGGQWNHTQSCCAAHPLAGWPTAAIALTYQSEVAIAEIRGWLTGTVGLAFGAHSAALTIRGLTSLQALAIRPLHVCQFLLPVLPSDVRCRVITVGGPSVSFTNCPKQGRSWSLLLERHLRASF